MASLNPIPRNRKHRSRTRTRRTLSLEGLERRELLTTLSFVNQVLTVDGSAGADTYQIKNARNGVVVTDATGRQFADGAGNTAFRNVRRIIVNGNDGDDNVSVELSSRRGQPRVTVNTAATAATPSSTRGT